MDLVGRVLETWRFPIKGLRGVKTNQVFLAEHGIEGDRAYMISGLEKEARGTETTRMTARDRKGNLLLAHNPITIEDELYVGTPTGTLYKVGSPELNEYLSVLLDTPVHILASEQGHFDLRPISLLGAATVRLLNDLHEQPVDHRRFRSNLYVEFEQQYPAQFERSLVGRRMRIGDEAEVEFVKGELGGKPVDGIGRCKVITYDPDEPEKQDAPLLSLVLNKTKPFEGCVGVYAKVVKTGQVKAGDPLLLMAA